MAAIFTSALFLKGWRKYSYIIRTFNLYLYRKHYHQYRLFDGHGKNT